MDWIIKRWKCQYIEMWQQNAEAQKMLICQNEGSQYVTGNQSERHLLLITPLHLLSGEFEINE